MRTSSRRVGSSPGREVVIQSRTATRSSPSTQDSSSYSTVHNRDRGVVHRLVAGPEPFVLLRDPVGHHDEVGVVVPRDRRLVLGDHIARTSRRATPGHPRTVAAGTPVAVVSGRWCSRPSSRWYSASAWSAHHASCGRHERRPRRRPPQPEQPTIGSRVAASSSLVGSSGQEHALAQGQGARDRDALLLAAGQLLDEVVPRLGEPDGVQGGVGLLDGRPRPGRRGP